MDKINLSYKIVHDLTLFDIFLIVFTLIAVFPSGLLNYKLFFIIFSIMLIPSLIISIIASFYLLFNLNNYLVHKYFRLNITLLFMDLFYYLIIYLPLIIKINNNVGIDAFRSAMAYNTVLLFLQYILLYKIKNFGRGNLY